MKNIVIKGKIRDNHSSHNFKIGDEVEIIGSSGKFWRCKGENDAHYYVRVDELQILD